MALRAERGGLLSDITLAGGESASESEVSMGSSADEEQRRYGKVAELVLTMAAADGRCCRTRARSDVLYPGRWRAS